MKRIALASIFILLLIVAVFYFADTDETETEDTTTLTNALAGDDEQFALASQSREFEFPADHGPHPDYKTEWWYVTGNVESTEGDAFGYQVTFFRIGLTATQPAIESVWATNQIYMAHVALTDITQQQYYSQERFARAALGLAGAQSSPVIKVWLEDWGLQGSDAALFPMKININDKDFALELNLNTQKPIVLQGDKGLGQKGPEPGNASYYYSYTRLLTEGEIRIEEKVFAVQGNSWLDREWSTSMLPKDVEGWDWFSIQLNNNTEIMFYRLRKPNGEATKFSRGSLVLANGDKINLSAEQLSATPTDWWQSPASGVRYPVAWRLAIPDYQIELEVEAAIQNQEQNHAVRYWEGAIKIRGEYQQQEVEGKGYLELAGYE